MPKNKFTKEDIKAIQSLTYNELGEAVSAGKYSVKDLRKAYTQMRDIAVKRLKRLETEKNVQQFGRPNLYVNNGEYFRKTKNLIGESELLKEIADVSKFLTSKKSTISGLKEAREKTIETMREAGLEIEPSDYVDFMKFMKWFHASEYAKKYDSDSSIVAEVFNNEKSNPSEWRKLFESYRGYSAAAPVRQY